jgi:hypothetical protein
MIKFVMGLYDGDGYVDVRLATAPESHAELNKAKADVGNRCRIELHVMKLEFFTTGEGAAAAEKAKMVQDVEAAIADAEREVDDFTAKITKATLDGADPTAFERKRRSTRLELADLNERLAILKPVAELARAEANETLEGMLRERAMKREREAEESVSAAAKAIHDAITSAFARWTLARVESAGCMAAKGEIWNIVAEISSEEAARRRRLAEIHGGRATPEERDRLAAQEAIAKANRPAEKSEQRLAIERAARGGLAEPALV